MTSPKARTEASRGESVVKETPVANSTDLTRVTTTPVSYTDGSVFKEVKTEVVSADPAKAKVTTAYIDKKVGGNTFWTMVFLVFIQILYVTMVYGPIAAFLVEMFPTKIRYTSMSLPYHIGNGVFGGLVPFLSTLIIEYTKTPENPGGDPLAGLWYPIGVAAVCLVIGSVYLTNKLDENVMD
jgi:hypothetical protein